MSEEETLTEKLSEYLHRPDRRHLREGGEEDFSR
jgi:hypothetical protein